MTAAGFRDVVVHEVIHESPLAAIAEHWEMMVRTSAPFALRKASLGERWPPISNGILERLRARLGEGPLSFAMPALVTIGRR